VTNKFPFYAILAFPSLIKFPLAFAHNEITVKNRGFFSFFGGFQNYF